MLFVNIFYIYVSTYTIKEKSNLTPQIERKMKLFNPLSHFHFLKQVTHGSNLLAPLQAVKCFKQPINLHEFKFCPINAGPKRLARGLRGLSDPAWWKGN